MSPPQLLGRKVKGVRPTPRISITLGRSSIPLRGGFDLLAHRLQQVARVVLAADERADLEGVGEGAVDRARVVDDDVDPEVLHRLVALRPGLRGEDEVGVERGELLEVGAVRVRERQHRDALQLRREAFGAAQRLADRRPA